MRSFCIITLLALCLSSCSLYRINSEDTSDEFYPPKPSYEEVMYLEDVRRPHTVIGKVTVNAERNQKMHRVLEKLRMEAANLGGDAITNISTDAGSGMWVRIKPDLFDNAHVRQNFTADVIVYK